MNLQRILTSNSRVIASSKWPLWSESHFPCSTLSSSIASFWGGGFVEAFHCHEHLIFGGIKVALQSESLFNGLCLGHCDNLLKPNLLLFHILGLFLQYKSSCKKGLSNPRVALLLHPILSNQMRLALLDPWFVFDDLYCVPAVLVKVHFRSEYHNLTTSFVIHCDDSMVGRLWVSFLWG